MDGIRMVLATTSFIVTELVSISNITPVDRPHSTHIQRSPWAMLLYFIQVFSQFIYCQSDQKQSLLEFILQEKNKAWAWLREFTLRSSDFLPTYL